MTLSPSIIQYMEELTQLVNRHAIAIEVPSSSLNHILKDIMENSYEQVIAHMTKCEIGRALNMDVTSSTLRGSTESFSFEINIDNMTWSISNNMGVSIDIDKMKNEVASDAELEPMVVTLVAMINADDTDLLDFTSQKVAFICKLYEVVTAKLTSVQDLINQQLIEEEPCTTNTAS